MRRAINDILVGVRMFNGKVAIPTVSFDAQVVSPDVSAKRRCAADVAEFAAKELLVDERFWVEPVSAFGEQVVEAEGHLLPHDELVRLLERAYLRGVSSVRLDRKEWPAPAGATL